MENTTLTAIPSRTKAGLGFIQLPLAMHDTRMPQMCKGVENASIHKE
jgi:hypothetical protein